MNVPFGSILVWTSVTKMASMFCGRDLNKSLCQMMEGFIRIICFFGVCLFFFGGALLPKSMGIFWNWRLRVDELSAFSGGFQRIHETVPGNPKCQAWCICAHTHPARHSPTEMASWKFLDELLEFYWFILVLVWQHSFENLRKPKHVQKCCFANFIEQIQAINKTHKNPSYFFNQRRCEWKGTRNPTCFLGKKWSHLWLLFSPGVDRFFHEICFPVKHRGSTESGDERKI